MKTNPPQAITGRQIETTPAAHRIGCVSFLNALPLIDGMGDAANTTTDETPIAVRYDVPSRLLADLEAGEVDIALCPVIDFFTAGEPLDIVPVGGIGCDGETLTVRLYSQVPLDELDAVHADTDSHTSVALMRVLLANLHGARPRVIDYHAREHGADHRPVKWPRAMLLIGDKVVTDSPPAVGYPHQLDLGHAWKRMTGLPFVFAVWMARRGTALGDLPKQLSNRRELNAKRIDEIVSAHAQRHGWPEDLARDYLGHYLRYAIGERELAAIERFGQLTHELGLIDELRPISLYHRAANNA